MTARLKETYNEKVFNALVEKFGYKNVMEVPKLEKVTINMGLGEAKDNAKIMESAVEELAMITGQKPVVTKARKSIANFKVRQGMPVGAKVTLRGENMWTFVDKFFNVEWNIPLRDYYGIYNYIISQLRAIVDTTQFGYDISEINTKGFYCNIFQKYIPTMRDAKRLINLFQSDYQILFLQMFL